VLVVLEIDLRAPVRTLSQASTEQLVAWNRNVESNSPRRRYVWLLFVLQVADPPMTQLLANVQDVQDPSGV
jgi:hypothetical protein